MKSCGGRLYCENRCHRAIWWKKSAGRRRSISSWFRNRYASPRYLDQQLSRPGNLEDPQQLGNVILADRSLRDAHAVRNRLVLQALAQVVKDVQQSAVDAERLRRYFDRAVAGIGRLTAPS